MSGQRTPNSAGRHVGKNGASVKVYGPDGAPLPNVEVTAWLPDGRAIQTRADDTGTVRVPAAAGDNAVLSVGDAFTPRTVDTSNGARIDLTRKPTEVVRVFGKLVQRSGQPASGVGVLLAQGKGAIAATVSDANGAFVLAFPPLDTESEKEKDKLELRLSVDEDALPFAKAADLHAGDLYGPVTLVVENEPPADGAVAPRLNLGDEANVLEVFERAPELLTRLRPARQNDACDPASPVDIATRVFYLQQLALMGASTGAQATLPTPVGQPVSLGNAIGGAARPQGGTASRTHGASPLGGGEARFGAILEFRQEWWQLGYALGDLLYSVPLAPGEETKLATVDWRRRDYATRQSAVDEASFQDSTVSQDESVNEAVRMISDKNVSGTTTGYGGAISIGPFSGGASTTEQDMNELVNSSTDATRNIHDRIRQVSNVLRNTRAFTVTEVSEEETSTVSTRVLRNHNHGHTLTFQYFQVLEHFLVRTLLHDVRPALLVPFSVAEFDSSAVMRFGYLIRRALLDTTLQQVLDDFLAGKGDTTTTAAGQAAGAAPVATSGKRKVRVRAHIAFDQGVTDEYDISLSLGDTLLTANLDIGDSQSGRTSTAELGPVSLDGVTRIGIQFGDTEEIGGGGWRSGSTTDSPKESTEYVTLELDDVSVEAQQPDGTWVEIAYADTLALRQGRRAMLSAPKAGGLETPVTVPTGFDRLIAHLNANLVYYNAAVIAGGDAGARYVALSMLPAGNGASLADLVVNEVAGTIGNYLCFPLVSRDQLPEGIDPPDVTWRSDPPRDARIVTLPTPGVFAESQLGGCNACEKIDNTRFWDWQRSPIPEEAPDITEAMLASRYQSEAQSLTPTVSNLTPQPIQMPPQPQPMITLGDATMSKLVEGLQLSDPKGVLDLINGLAGASSANYQAELGAFKDMFGQLLSQGGGMMSGLAQGAAGMAGEAGAAGAAEAGTAAAGEGLAATAELLPLLLV